jgi:hypothetical protein
MHNRSVQSNSSLAYALLAVLILFLLMLPPTISAQKICNYCQKKIESSWLEVEAKYYHPEHFVCFNCLKPIGDKIFFIQNERYYDSACFSTFISNRCDYCGKPIISESVHYDSKIYHQTCYNESVGAHCVVCTDVVLEEFFVDKRGNAVCKRHKDDAFRCFACQSFLSPIFNGSWEKYDDGRIICENCLKTMIVDMRDANKLMDEVKEELSKTGIVIDKKFKLSFVSMQDLKGKFENFVADHLGVTKYEKTHMLGGLFSFNKFEINILYGLPKSLLRSVMAHELMHVWLFTNSPQPQDQQMCEGTCQYAAYLVLQSDSTEDGSYFLEHLMEQDDKIYGQGFQNVYDYVNSVGLKPWLDYLKHNEDAPW